MTFTRTLFFTLVTAVCFRAQQPAADKFSAARERQTIPGQTMGQKMESLLFWTQPEKNDRFPQMHTIFPSFEVPTGKTIKPLSKGVSLEKKIGGDKLDTYFKENHIAGVVVLKDGKIQLEKYGQNADRNTVWTSFSVAKSVTSMLLGAALKDGSIQNMDDPLEKYIKAFANEDYGKVTVRQLLTMTSGIAWNEDYADAQSDVAQMYHQPCHGKEAHIISYMKKLKSVQPAGSAFNYSTGETDLLGILIQEATGKNLAAYLSEKIWQPWGMEHSGYWLADECSGQNIGGSGLSATLRDFARLGDAMLYRDTRGHHPFLADEYLQNATSLLIPTGKDGSGYGYLWWRFPNGSYAAFGIFGQMIYINPATKVVIAQNAAWPAAGSKELSARRAAFIEEVERALE